MSELYETCSNCGTQLHHRSRSDDHHGICIYCARRYEEELYRKQQEIDDKRREEIEDAERERRDRERERRSENSDNGCYISTASCHAVGLDRESDFLNDLRKFRDNFVKSLPLGQEIVHNYYNSAPKIISEIDSKSNSKNIWTKIFNEMVKPCHDLVIEKRYKEAFELYYNYHLELIKKYIK